MGGFLWFSCCYCGTGAENVFFTWPETKAPTLYRRQSMLTGHRGPHLVPSLLEETQTSILGESPTTKEEFEVRWTREQARKTIGV